MADEQFRFTDPETGAQFTIRRPSGMSDADFIDRVNTTINQAYLEGVVSRATVGEGEAFGRGARDTVTFGFDDEIGEFISTGAGEEIRERKAEARRQQPGAFMAGQVAGAAPAALIPGGQVARGAGGLARAAATGAGENVLFAIGSQEGDLSERVGPQLAAPAAIGAVAAPLGVGAANVAERAVRGGRQALSSARARLPGAGGQTAAQRVGAGTVARDIEQALGPGGVDEAIARVGDDGLPISAQTPELSQATASIARMAPGQTRRIVREGAEALTRKTRQSAQASLQSNLRGADNSVAWLGHHIKRQKSQGKAGYQAAFRAAPTVDPQISQHIMATIDEGAWKTASRALGRNKMPPLKKVNGQIVPPQNMSLEMAEQYYRALRDEANAAFRKGRNGAGSALEEQATTLKNMLDATYPDLQATRLQYANDFDITRAFDEGKKALRGDAEEIELFMSTLGPAERDAFNKGVWASIKRGMGRAGDTSASDLRTLVNTDNGRQILEMTMDGTPERITNEINKFYAARGLQTKTQGGPPTATRQATDEARTRLGGTAAEMAFDLSTSGGVTSLARAMLGRMSRAQSRHIKPAEAEEAVRILMSSDPQFVERSLRQFQAGSQEAMERLFNQFRRVGARIGGGFARAAQDPLSQGAAQ